MAQSIYEEPAVIKRTERRGVLHEITSNGTIAAAVMVGAALLALVVANGPAFEVWRSSCASRSRSASARTSSP